MTNLEFNLNNEEYLRQNNKKQARVYHFPQSEKRSPLDTKRPPVMFVDVLKDKNPVVASFLFDRHDKEPVFYNKSQCEAYVKALKDKIANTPNMEPRANLEGTLRSFEYALKLWPEENK